MLCNFVKLQSSLTAGLTGALGTRHTGAAIGSSAALIHGAQLQAEDARLGRACLPKTN